MDGENPGHLIVFQMKLLANGKNTLHRVLHYGKNTNYHYGKNTNYAKTNIYDNFHCGDIPAVLIILYEFRDNETREEKQRYGKYH